MFWEGARASGLWRRISLPGGFVNEARSHVICVGSGVRTSLGCMLLTIIMLAGSNCGGVGGSRQEGRRPLDSK